MKIGVALGSYLETRQGGAEVQVSYLVDHFLRSGHEVFYVAYGKNNQIEPEEKPNGLRLYRVKKPWRGYKELNWRNRKTICRILDREGPDVMYQRGDYHFWDLISRYGSKRGIPVFTGLSMERHCQRSKIGSGSDPLRIILFERMKKRYYAGSSVIISQTDHQKRMLKKNYGFDSIIIPNGHPVPKGPFKKDGNIIIWVANIKKIKRPEIFIDVARKLEGKGYKFMMVGREDKGQYQKKLEEEIDSVDDLEYIGERSLEETNILISKSSLLVNTSMSEGFSNTYIQAWMRETPVITLDADPDNMIRDIGLGIRSKSRINLHLDIENLMEDEKKLHEIALSARRYSVGNFDIAKIGNKYLDIFERSLKIP